MSRLGGNPLGTGLLAACALLVLVGLALTLAWRGPGAVDPAALEGDVDMNVPAMPAPRELGQLEDYAIVNERPVFNATRRPVVEVVVEEAEEAPAEEAVAETVSDPPKVRLTGVVITPEERLVTLTPDAGGESLLVREGMPLEGEYVGWSVDEVEPRAVRLTSSNGQRLDFELMVYDTMIEAPPTPEPPPQAEPQETAAEDGEEDAPAQTRSRADEIRERIRQRREELRAQAQAQSEERSDEQAERANAYQDAIRSLMGGSAAEDDDGQNEEDDSGDN